MSNLENDKLLEQTMEEYTATQDKLRDILNHALDSTLDTIDQYRKIKTITCELKDFNDKILRISGENPNNYPYRAKGPDPYYNPNPTNFEEIAKQNQLNEDQKYYVPPTESTGDADYLKDVPKKLEKFNDKHDMEENDALERPEIYE